MAAAVAQALDAPPAQALAGFEAAHGELCGWLGIESPQRLLLTPGCTSALAIAIGDLPWQPGDVAVTSTMEHHALVRPLAQLVRQCGIQHVVVGRAPDGPIDLVELGELLSKGGVRLVAVTAASNVTGECLPVADIARLAHAHGALLLVDAAQTLGLVPTDVRTLGADLLTFAGHKGPLGPHGIGGLWADAGVRFESPSAVCEVTPGGGPPTACSPMPGYCDAGSVNLSAAAGLAAAVAWHRGAGAGSGAHACGLAAALRGALRGHAGCEVLGADTAAHTASLSLRIAGLPLERAEQAFAARGLAVRAGQHCAPLALGALGIPGGCLRISFGPFNDAADVDAVRAAVDALASGAGGAV